MGVVDPRSVEALLDAFPVAALDGDGQVVVAAEHLAVRPEVEAGEVEEGEGVAVADVEEEVRRPGVVAVLEHLDEREAEQARVELDGAFDVATDQRNVVDAASSARRSLRSGLQVAPGDLGRVIGRQGRTAAALRTLLAAAADVDGTKIQLDIRDVDGQR